MENKLIKKVFCFIQVVLMMAFMVSCSTTGEKSAGESTIPVEGTSTALPTKEPRILGEGEAIVSTFEDFQAKATDVAVKVLYIDSDIEVVQDFTFERNNDLTIYIDEGVTLVASSGFTPVLCNMINNGTIIVKGAFDHACTLTNNGTIMVKSGGTASSGMVTISNSGNISVENGGILRIERGTQLINTGILDNNGYISVNNGGTLSNETGSIMNSGTIDIGSYFNGDIASITGTGVVNDNR